MLLVRILWTKRGFASFSFTIKIEIKRSGLLKLGISWNVSKKEKKKGFIWIKKVPQWKNTLKTPLLFTSLYRTLFIYSIQSNPNYSFSTPFVLPFASHILLLYIKIGTVKWWKLRVKRIPWLVDSNPSS